MQEEEKHRKCEMCIHFFKSDICFKKKPLRTVELQSLYITGSGGLSVMSVYF